VVGDGGTLEYLAAVKNAGGEFLSIAPTASTKNWSPSSLAAFDLVIP